MFDEGVRRLLRNYLTLYSMKRYAQILFRHFVRIACVKSTLEPALPLLQKWTSLEGGLTLDMMLTLLEHPSLGKARCRQTGAVSFVHPSPV
jgi:hypothetical protein